MVLCTESSALIYGKSAICVRMNTSLLASALVGWYKYIWVALVVESDLFGGLVKPAHPGFEFTSVA